MKRTPFQDVPDTSRMRGSIAGLIAVAICSLLALLPACRRDTAPTTGAGRLPIVIDTDAGVDDLLAIAWLLATPEADIDAITVGTGLTHVQPGARNVLKLLALVGRADLPVFIGRESLEPR